VAILAGQLLPAGGFWVLQFLPPGICDPEKARFSARREVARRLRGERRAKRPRPSK
jgi:hypothetical protein